MERENKSDREGMWVDGREKLEKYKNTQIIKHPTKKRTSRQNLVRMKNFMQHDKYP